MTLDDELEIKEPTIEEHIAKARELTPQQTRVTEPAFEELIRAVEKINIIMNFLGGRDTVPETPQTEPNDEEE